MISFKTKRNTVYFLVFFMYLFLTANYAIAYSFGGVNENVNNANPLNTTVTLNDVSELGIDILTNETDWRIKYAGDTDVFGNVCVPITETQLNDSTTVPLSQNGYVLSVVGCSNPNNFAFQFAINVFVQPAGTVDATIYTNTTTTPTCGINSTRYKVISNENEEIYTLNCAQSFSLNNSFFGDTGTKIG
ncbi:MAG: hypothetical protein AAB649_03560, partial [Patescibacteria group bacterium]